MQVPTSQTDAVDEIDEHDFLFPDRATANRGGISDEAGVMQIASG